MFVGEMRCSNTSSLNGLGRFECCCFPSGKASMKSRRSPMASEMPLSSA